MMEHCAMRIVALFMALMLLGAPGVSARSMLQWTQLSGGANSDGMHADDSSILTKQNMETVLRRHATPQEHAVMFSTFSFSQDITVSSRVLDSLRNFCYHADRQGLLPHLMLITKDKLHWQAARAAGLPAFWDRVSPLSGEFVGVNRLDVAQKHWLAASMLDRGFKVLFLDSDIIIMDDLLQPFRTDWDIQGLSDFRKVTSNPPVGAVTSSLCGLYVLTRNEQVETRAIMRFWRRDPEGKEKDLHYNVSTPCQSTGLWYVRPTEQTKRFMWAVTNRVYREAPFQWEQTAWNELLPTFLWGQGDELPIRYRLLPVDQFSNIGIYLHRKAQGLPVNQVALHAGFLHGSSKVEVFRKLGFWHPDKFMAKEISRSAIPASLLGRMPVPNRMPHTPLWSFALLLAAATALLQCQRRRPGAVKHLIAVR